jgi:hypothetical protein
MKRLVCVLGWVAIGSVVQAQDHPSKSTKLTDPVEILKKADEASKPVKSFRYTASAEGLHADAERFPKVTGKVIAVPAPEGKQPLARTDAKVTRPGSSDVEEITVGCDGENYYVIDAKNKKAYVDLDPGVVGGFRRIVGGLRMQEYGHEKPFSDEINGKVKELKGIEKVGEEECYHVYVEYGEQAGGLVTDWWFSTKDFLPRRSDRVRTNAQTGAKGGGKLVITNLEINPKVDPNDFKIKIPEGFTKVDDFAP